MAADALAPSFADLSAAIVLNMWDKNDYRQYGNIPTTRANLRSGNDANLSLFFIFFITKLQHLKV